MPGTPDHPITLAAADRRWRVRFAGHVIADSGDSVVLQEASYPPVIYFPRDDVGMAYLGKTAHTTHCPYKGDASYFTVDVDGEIVEDGVWSYETPMAGMEPIAGLLAFYGNRGFEIYAVDEAQVAPEGQPAAGGADVDEVILHTDAGDGTSQRPHWAPNVDGPPRDGGVR